MKEVVRLLSATATGRKNHMVTRIVRLALFAVSALAAPFTVAGWTVDLIRSPYASAPNLSIEDVSPDGQFVGRVGTGGAVWNSSPSSATYLRPVWASAVHVWGTDGTTQAGSYSIGGNHFAAKWNGTADSFVSLHPEWASFSYARAVEGDIVAGWADYTPFFWQGSQMTVLEGVNGGINAVDEGKLGVSSWDFGAALYDVATATWTHLEPAGSTGSELNDADGGIQVGRANFGGVLTPGYWRGTSDSFVALQSMPGKHGTVLNVHGNLAAGSLWNPDGSDRRWVAWDINSGQMWQLATPSGIRVSWVTAVHVDDLGNFNVYARGSEDYKDLAVHWQYAPVPEPGTMAALGLGLALLARRARRR
jgi:hypothetical protein